MLTEAIRARLVELGVAEADSWSKEQIIDHIDQVFTQYTQPSVTQETFLKVLEEFWTPVQSNLVTLHRVLRKLQYSKQGGDL